MSTYHDVIAAGVNPYSYVTGVEPERYLGSYPGEGLLAGRELWVGSSALRLSVRPTGQGLAERKTASVLHGLEVPADSAAPAKLHLVEALTSHEDMCWALGLPHVRRGLPVRLVPDSAGAVRLVMLSFDDANMPIVLETLFHPGMNGHPDVDPDTALSVATALVRTHGVDIAANNPRRPLEITCEVAEIGSVTRYIGNTQDLSAYTVQGPLEY